MVCHEHQRRDAYLKIVQNEPEKKMLCPTCGVVFEYKHKDIQHVGHFIEFPVLYCPNCNERISEEAGYAMDCNGGIGKSRKYIMSCGRVKKV